MARKKTSSQSKGRRRRERPDRRPRRLVCYFCTEKVDYIDYKDTAMLRRFMSDRAKIRARRVTGTCGRHQRELATAIKNGRELALLPYTGLQGESR
ncbi:MAG: 30S ribosomal protein S18 [Acidimicrobiia bacterium]|nr:30S ribosomal protein S18 [Acidimicrobiia bacterium]NNF09976.1 30S ribosomal protein S18 [Acidimicrobiia bacterium]NNL71622.1 30S ribosomal protein S18 [Acidimicrobiia bacterium]